MPYPVGEMFALSGSSRVALVQPKLPSLFAGGPLILSLDDDAVYLEPLFARTSWALPSGFRGAFDATSYATYSDNYTLALGWPLPRSVLVLP